MRGLDGLFAREIPNVKPGLTPLGGVVFYPRRFDLFAVSQTPSQSLIGVFLSLVLLCLCRSMRPACVVFTIVTQ